MKKSLVLAMAMAMGVTASAYAANPFSDVPAGHWAYDSISQLADAGVVEGYGTGFGGDKLMTRYEMAQIVAKAMAKGANCDKLAAEFADELDALGVRVAKLEKKVDNVKITGNIRYSYADSTKYTGTTKKGRESGKQYNRFRSRIFVNGAINNNWSYTGMLENDRMLGKDNDGDAYRDGDDVKLKRAYLNGRVGGLKVEGGRCYFVQGDMMDGNADGLKVGYKVGKVGLSGWAFKNQETGNGFFKDTNNTDHARVYMAKAETNFGKLGAFVEYWKGDLSNIDQKVFELGLSYPVAKGLTLAAQYYKGDGDVETGSYNGDDNGYEVSLKYLGAKAAKPGTWGLWVTYDDRPADTFFKPTCFNTYGYNQANWFSDKYSNNTFEDGFKGFEVGGNYTFAKNIVGEVRYFAYKGREAEKSKANTLWAHVVFTF